MPGWVDYKTVDCINSNWQSSRGAMEAIAFAYESDRRWNVANSNGPKIMNNYSYSAIVTYPAMQGEVPAGGGYSTFAGTFTSDSTMRSTLAVTVHVDRINYPAFYYQFTEDPMVAVLVQIPYTLEWSVNVGQFLLQAPQLPGAFDAQGKIFEQKFNLFSQWLQNTFLPQSETKIIYLQQVIIDAPYVPGDLMDTGDITIPGINLNQGEVINFGDGGKLFNGPQN